MEKKQKQKECHHNWKFDTVIEVYSKEVSYYGNTIEIRKQIAVYSCTGCGATKKVQPE